MTSVFLLLLLVLSFNDRKFDVKKKIDDKFDVKFWVICLFDVKFDVKFSVK